MANQSFEYRIINPLERPKAEDLNIAQGQAHGDTRTLARHLFGGQEGFLGGGFLLTASPWYPIATVVRINRGIFFQFKSEEYNIGGIPGLNDEITYKVGAIGTFDLECQPVPTGANEKRYDLLQVRALTGTERLTNLETVDILNPALQSFIPEPNLAKTLTTSFSSGILAGQYPVYTASSEPVTGAMSYVSGEVTVTTDWNSVPKPTPAAGYLPVGYIKRYTGQTTMSAGDIEDARPLLSVATSVLGDVPVSNGGTGQTSLPSGEILLGNGTSPITSTAVLPVSKGGTGNGLLPGYMGSVAWFNTSEQKFQYTQAIPVGGESPVSGYLLASNATGAPTWIAPGSAGQVLVSTGTAWESTPTPVKNTTYTTPGVYTHQLSASAKFVQIVCIGAGGGGGGGAMDPGIFDIASAGAGGGGGGLTVVTYSIASLLSVPSSNLNLVVQVGAGGAGGAGGFNGSPPVDYAGQTGNSGQASEVVMNTGFHLAEATGGGGGGGGEVTAVGFSIRVAGGAPGEGATGTGGRGGRAGEPAPFPDPQYDYNGYPAVNGGGGGGGGTDQSDNIGAGGLGGNMFLAFAAGGASAPVNADGNPGEFDKLGTGGGGGSTAGNVNTPVNGKTGGAGGSGGGGGGGGGKAAAPNSGGVGGAGGNGLVIIREW